MRSPSSVATSDSPQSMTAGDQGDLQLTTGPGSLNLPAAVFQSSVLGPPTAAAAPAGSAAPSTGSPPSLAGSPEDITGAPTIVDQHTVRSSPDILPELDNDAFLHSTMGFMSKMKDRLSGIVAASTVETFLSSPKPEETSPGRVSSLSSPRPPSLVNETLGGGGVGGGGDLSYRSSLLNGSAGGEDSYTCELRKQREFIPECKKDDKYWERRRKNNEAAKRSREKRRQNDMLMEREIAELKDRNEALLRENAALKLRLGMPLTPAPPTTSTPEVGNQKTERLRPHAGAGAGGNSSRSFSDEGDERQGLPPTREDRNQNQVTAEEDSERGRWRKLDEHHHVPSRHEEEEEPASRRPPPLLSPSDAAGVAVSLNALDLITLQRLLSALASGGGGGTGLTRWDQMVNGEQLPPPTSSSPSPDATVSAAVASLLLRQARKPLQSLVVKNTLLESLRWQQSGGGGLLEPKRSATDKDADAQNLPDGPLDLRHPLRSIYTPQVSLAGEPVRQRLSTDKLSELAVITSDDALSSTPQGASTQRSSTASFSVSSPSSQRQAHPPLLSEAQMAAVSATLTPSPLLNQALQPLLTAPGLQAANQLSTAAVAAAAAAQLLCQQKDDVGFSTGSLSNSGLLFPLGGGVGGQALTEAQRQFGGHGLPVTSDGANTSGSSCRSTQRRRGGPTSQSPSRLMDERYRERRRRNNEAVRRCRENKRARIHMRDEVTEKIQNENQSLRNELSGLSNEVQALRQLIAANRATSLAPVGAATENKADVKVLAGSQAVATEREPRAAAVAATTTTTAETLNSQPEELWASPTSASLETAKYAWPKKGLPRLQCRRRLTAPPYHESLAQTEAPQTASSATPSSQAPPPNAAPEPPAALAGMMREAPILQH